MPILVTVLPLHTRQAGLLMQSNELQAHYSCHYLCLVQKRWLESTMPNHWNACQLGTAQAWGGLSPLHSQTPPDVPCMHWAGCDRSHLLGKCATSSFAFTSFWCSASCLIVTLCNGFCWQSGCLRFAWQSTPTANCLHWGTKERNLCIC